MGTFKEIGHVKKEYFFGRCPQVDNDGTGYLVLVSCKGGDSKFDTIWYIDMKKSHHWNYLLAEIIQEL